MFLFPFGKVQKDSRIVLYGMGEVGKSFYSQIYHTNYCTLVGWTDQHMGRDAEPSGILISMEEITCLEYDHVVIALAKEEDADKVTDQLLELGIDPGRIVWDKYKFSELIWPDDMTLFRSSPDFYLKVMRLFFEYPGDFPNYQSFPMLGLTGKHSTQERIARYGLDEYLRKDQNVLDIGCNSGFFDLQIAKKVNSVLGVDIEHNLIQIANATKEHLGIDNCTFAECDFNSWHSDDTYDFIIAFAILYWLEVDPEKIALRLRELLSPGGYILAEAQGVKFNFKIFIDTLTGHGMRIVRKGQRVDLGGRVRRYFLLKDDSE